MTDAELAVLKVIWQSERQTVREITGHLYPKSSASDVATVQKLLQRLEAKSLVERHRDGHAHCFTANVTQQEYAGNRLATVAQQLSDGSVAPLLVHLVESQQLSEQDRNEIRKLLDKHRD